MQSALWLDLCVLHTREIDPWVRKGRSKCKEQMKKTKEGDNILVRSIHITRKEIMKQQYGSCGNDLSVHKISLVFKFWL